ncbi:MAG: hypothetical protein AAB944_00655, partial [Patescibacteria group bacterium]
MHIEETQLKEFILDSDLISRADFEAVEKKALDDKESIGKILVEEGKITDDDLRKVQAHILGIPFVDLKGEKIDFEILSLIPEPIARNHNIVAFRSGEKTLE